METKTCVTPFIPSDSNFDCNPIGFSITDASPQETNFSTIPDALITYTRDTVFHTWQALELQLSQVDQKKDPEIYNALNERAEGAFNSWLTFRYIGRRG